MDAPPNTLPPAYRHVQGIFSIFEEEIRNSILRKTGGTESSDRFMAHVLRLSTDLTFNASVGLLEDGRPAYTFNLGACLALTDACSTVCCDPDFMREVPLPTDGVVILDARPQPSRFVDYGFAMHDGEMIWPLARMLRDSNDEAPRAQLGNHLFEMATKLLGLHEQAHVLSGHLLYLRSLGLGQWREAAPGQGAHGLPAAESRAMELEADGKALSILAGGQKIAPGRRSTPRGFWMKEANHFLGFMRLTLIGMAVIVGLLDRTDRLHAAQPDARTHPTAAARLLNMLEHAVGWTRGEFADPVEGDTWISGVLYECDRVFVALGCTRLDLEAVQEHFNTDPDKRRHPIAIEVARTQAICDSLIPRLGAHRVSMARLLGLPTDLAAG